MILSLRASYEAVRKQSYQILLSLPNNLKFLTQQKIKSQFEAALASSKSLVIKIYESSGYMMSILFTKHLSMLKTIIWPQLPPTEQIGNEINFDVLEFLVGYLENEFDVFQQNFLIDWEKFYINAPHGLLTILSNVIQILFGDEQRNRKELLSNLNSKEDVQKKYYLLFNRVMRVLGKIMLFATKISAENVSTSVFDNSMTKEKLIKEKSIKF